MNELNRRKFLTRSAAFLALSPAIVIGTRAVAASRVDPNDPQAKALAYVHESTVDGSICANCQLYTGPADADWGGCAIFPGKQVAAGGWCSAWVKKAG
jgi:hypothetical protein